MILFCFLDDVDPTNLGPPCYLPSVFGGERKLFCLAGVRLWVVEDDVLYQMKHVSYSRDTSWSFSRGEVKPLDACLPMFGTLQAAAEFRDALYAGECRMVVKVQLDFIVANYVLVMDPPAGPVCWVRYGPRVIQLCGEAQFVMALTEKLVAVEQQLTKEDVPEEFWVDREHHVDPSTLALMRCSFCSTLGYSEARKMLKINL